VEVTTGEIAGGLVMKTGCAALVMKTGCPALEELAAVSKHAKITNLKAEFSLRRRIARTSRLILGSVAGSMADLTIFMGCLFFRI
jgi:hypothetical protein